MSAVLPENEESVAVPFSSMDDVIEDIRRGRMVIVCDDEDRENEGDLTMAAELVTPEAINFMATHGRGLICLPMKPEMIDYLGLPEMAKHNAPHMDTAFTVSIDAVSGITSGISATDRAHTIRAAADPESRPGDFISPGHVFPLRARPGGVVERPGQTEAAVDLALLAGLRPAGAICEVMKKDGTMARVPDLEEFSKEHGMRMVTVEQIIEYRESRERRLRYVGEYRLPTKFGVFRARTYEDEGDGLVHTALLAGGPAEQVSPTIHMHPACALGDTFGSKRCGCGARLEAAMKRVQRDGEGVILYLGDERHGALSRSVSEHHLHEHAPGAINSRHRHAGAEILEELGMERASIASGGFVEAIETESEGFSKIEHPNS